MRYQAISLHLSHSQTTVTPTAFQGLSSQPCHGPTRTSVDFILYKMLQALVKGRTEEDECIQRSAGMTTVEAFVAVSLETAIMHCLGNYLHIDGADERSSITLITQKRGYLTHETLHQVTYSHTRGNRVWVDNNIRANTITAKGHIFLPIHHTNSTLLAVTGGELITHLRNTKISDSNFSELVSLLVG